MGTTSFYSLTIGGVGIVLNSASMWKHETRNVHNREDYSKLLTEIQKYVRRLT